MSNRPGAYDYLMRNQRRALSLVVDAAQAMDDAYVRGDTDALREAAAILIRNADAA